MFASNLAVTMSVTALLKDQNDKIILNKFTVYTRGNTEMGLLSMACNSCQNEKRLHCVYMGQFTRKLHHSYIIKML